MQKNTLLSQYILPITKLPIVITQGFDNPNGNHNSLRSKLNQTYAIDIGAKPGTQVIAARSGIVSNIFSENNECIRSASCKNIKSKIGNHVVLKHEDGLHSLYEHLDGDFIKNNLNLGDKIKQGEPFAKTGLSGFIGLIPHLHFMVYDSKSNSQKIYFDNYSESLYQKDLKLDEIMKHHLKKTFQNEELEKKKGFKSVFDY